MSTKERIEVIRKSVGNRIDKFLNKWISRKLTVLVIGTVGMFTGGVLSSDWTIVAVVYIGAQASVEIAEKLFKARYGAQV